MQGVIIHAPKDLRIEAVARPARPGRGPCRHPAGGICGSDLHYYHHGGFGAVRIKEPMALGHEIAGTVARSARRSARVRARHRVAVNPSQPCGLPLLPRGQAQRMPRHAFHRQRDAVPARSGRLPPEPDGLGGTGRADRRL